MADKVAGEFKNRFVIKVLGGFKERAKAVEGLSNYFFGLLG